MADDSIVGAWEYISDSRLGHLLVTGSHYASVSAPKNRRRSAGEQATPDEALEALLSRGSHSVTYTLSGSKRTVVPVSNTQR